MEENIEVQFLPEHLFNKIKEECPDFLRSYYILSTFYQHLSEHFDRKVLKNGKIILTPKAIKNEKSSDSSSD